MLGAVLQRGADHQRGELGLEIQQQRHRTRSCSRGHARSRQLEQRVLTGADHEFGVLTYQRRSGGQQTTDAVAGRHQVRLDQVVVARRALRAVAGDDVVGAEDGPLGIERANRQRVRAGARHRDATADRRAVRELSQIAGRRHHHEPGVVGTRHGLAQRVVAP